VAELTQLPTGYHELLQDLKGRIRAAQMRASFALSRELVLLYWSIGREILARQHAEGWGARVIDRLGADLQKEFPGVEGYSPRNLKYMRSLAEAWPDPEIVPQLVALLPWGHLRVLLDQLKDREQREWYLRAAVEYGWSRNVLVLQIKSGLREREGKAITNFQRALPPPDSDLAEQVRNNGDGENGGDRSFTHSNLATTHRILFMRVLLDAKDLINVVEHSKPVSLADLESWLKTKGARLVFSLENIRALAGPLGSDPASLPRIVQYLRDFEALPHCFISCHIDLLELRSAIKGYDNGLRYEAIDPYVLRFDFTFDRMAQPSRSNYTMAETVTDLYRSSPRIFAPRPNLHRIHAYALSEDRVRWGVDRLRYELPKEPFVETLVTSLGVPDGKAQKIADWIAGDPERCPALWLIRAMGAVMSKIRPTNHGQAMSSTCPMRWRFRT
jgi:predicted nuclease of restriction endonuclease-like (RecB) superfamily